MVAVLLTLLPLTPRPAMAMDWDALWSREDQRAPALIEEDPEQAARILDNPQWRGSALYRSGDYESAAGAFASEDTPRASYNRGNALARAGKLEEALEAYENVLAKQPGHEDALFNRDLVKQLLEQQQNQSSGDGSESSDQDGNQQQQGNQQNSQNGSDTQNQDGDPSDQAGQNQPDNQHNGQQKNEPEDSQQNGQSDQQEKQEESAQQRQRDADASESDGQTSRAPAELDTSPLTQGQEQWLRRVPDNPGGLLRRKFLQQYQERETPSDEGDTPW